MGWGRGGGSEEEEEEESDRTVARYEGCMGFSCRTQSSSGSAARGPDLLGLLCSGRKTATFQRHATVQAGWFKLALRAAHVFSAPRRRCASHISHFPQTRFSELCNAFFCESWMRTQKGWELLFCPPPGRVPADMSTTQVARVSV